ncbi:MAG: hypothetical protein ABII21_00555 [bacterium]
MTKVKRRAAASPKCMILITVKIKAAIIVSVYTKLLPIDRRIKLSVYQIVTNSSTKNGKYNPGIRTSLSSSGSTYNMTAVSAPYNDSKLSIFGIHFIL